MPHLKYYLPEADSHGEHRHAMAVMESMGITYQDATPQTIGDQWWFWNCKNVPTELPPYITILDADPLKMVGYGLSAEGAQRIANGA